MAHAGQCGSVGDTAARADVLTAAATWEQPVHCPIEPFNLQLLTNADDSIDASRAYGLPPSSHEILYSVLKPTSGHGWDGSLCRVIPLKLPLSHHLANF